MDPPDDIKKCPYCAETIRAEAIVCRYCGRDLVDDIEEVRRTRQVQWATTNRVKARTASTERLLMFVSLGLVLVALGAAIVLVAIIFRLPGFDAQISRSTLVGSSDSTPATVQVAQAAQDQPAIVASTMTPTSVVTETPALPTVSKVDPTLLPTSTDVPAALVPTPTATDTPLPTRTPTPTSTPTRAECPKTNQVANLYGAPSRESMAVSYLKAGTCVQIVARNEAGDWYLLPLGIWIASEDVDGAPDISAIPVAIPTPTPTVTLTPTVTPTPTNSPIPTNTSVPTITPIPTAIPPSMVIPAPIPTATELPITAQGGAAPSCTEIFTAKDSMTNAQYEIYREGLKGTQVADWTGVIHEVGDRFLGRYKIGIEIISNFCLIEYYTKSEEEALSFQLGQPVVVGGAVDLITSGVIFDVVIQLQDDTVSIR